MKALTSVNITGDSLNVAHPDLQNRCASCTKASSWKLQQQWLDTVITNYFN